MSLISALNIGKSALVAHQAAIGVISNNISNVGNPDYTRQVANLSPNADRQDASGMLVGSGVVVDSIQRQIDDALEGRIRSANSDSQAASTRQDILGQVESIFNALGDNDLSSQMSTFFNGWSNLANDPQNAGLRQIVLQNGDSLASTLKSLRSQVGDVQTGINNRIKGLVNDADALAGKVADLNQQIQTDESGGQQANALRDQRDAALKQLAGLVDIKTQDTGNGMVNVMIGSEPIVIGNTSRGLTLATDPSGNTVLSTKTDKTSLIVSSGTMGALLGLGTDVANVAGQVDTLAGNMIFELNKIHSSGQGLEGFSQTTATNAVSDPTAALNTQAAGLAFPPTNGSFVVHVKQKGTGLETSTLVQVDLDGLNGNDTTLNSLQASLGSINGVSASISAGKLSINSNSSDVEISFSQDSSGVLASLGINSFFTGKDASTIAVNSNLKNNLNLLAASQNGEPADNQTARAIAAMESSALSGLKGQSLKDAYQNLTNGLAVSVSAAKTSAESADTISQTLSVQREALSGVSMDEEAVNLMREQRAFQGAARVISAVDEMMKTLLQMT
jgi:flagellar hook-associated protein 1 FlgK